MTETVTVTFLTNHEVPLDELPEWWEDPQEIADAAMRVAKSSSDIQDIAESPEQLADVLERKEEIGSIAVIGPQ